jgi:hypothetical protein
MARLLLLILQESDFRRWSSAMLIHDISQGALAAAVLALGLVMLLELRSLSRLRSTVARDLGRVFEQLDLLRFDSQQIIEVQTSAPPPQPPVVQPRLAAISTDNAGDLARISRLAAEGVAVKEIADRCSLPAGETRLLLALQTAQTRRAAPSQQNPS